MSLLLLRTFPGAVTSLPLATKLFAPPRKAYTLHFSTSTPVTRSQPLSSGLIVPLASSRPLHHPLGILPTWYVVVVQWLSHVRLCNPMDRSTPGFPITISWDLLKIMSIESMIPSTHLSCCHPLLLLPSIFPSLRVFSNESVRIRWPKYWNFSFSICPSNEYSGLISFRIDSFDLPAVQGTLASPLHHHSSKASILWHSAFIMVQLSHPYMTTGKIIALTIRTFVSKVMSLLFNMLSRFVIAFCSSHRSAQVSAKMSLPWPPIYSSRPSHMLFKSYITLLFCFYFPYPPCSKPPTKLQERYAPWKLSSSFLYPWHWEQCLEYSGCSLHTYWTDVVPKRPSKNNQQVNEEEGRSLI